MPMHRKRTWVVVPAGSAGWLAEKLVNHSWCSCAGWSLGGHLFLNDQTSEDGAFEVAVVKPPAGPGGQWARVESITFGRLSSTPVLAQRSQDTGRRWAPLEISRDYVTKCVEGHYDAGAWLTGPLSVETPEQHGRCHLCA